MELSYGSCHRKKLLEVYKVILILICAGGVGKYGSGLSKKKLGLGVGKFHFFEQILKVYINIAILEI